MNLFLRKKQEYSIDTLLSEVKQINNSLVICPNNTKNNWLGIKNATLSLFPENTLVLPQNYSNQIVSDGDLEAIITSFKNNGGEIIVLSGFPPYFSKIVEFCAKYQLKCNAIFHGGLAEVAFGRNKGLENILRLAQEQKINRVGFIKKGLAEMFEKTYQISANNLSLPIGTDIPETVHKNTSEVHIGILSNNTYNKNRHTQVAAAAMIENSIIHIFEPNEFDYLLSKERIKVHSHMNRNDFLALVGIMDINLYCSYSESWGQVISESLALGVPCLVSNNSGVLDDLPHLKERLMVDQYDNPNEIALKIQENLNLEIKPTEVIDTLNKKAQERVNTFIKH